MRLRLYYCEDMGDLDEKGRIDERNRGMGSGSAR
jgi:hypothetical protein